MARVQPGTAVAIFGAGPVGLLAGYSSILRGAAEVYVVDAIADRSTVRPHLGTCVLRLITLSLKTRGRDPMRVGFVGLGGMGRAMATVLLRAGHEVTVWNRTRSRADALRREGAAVAATPAEAARAGIVISMLADDAAVEAVTRGPDGIPAGLPPGGLHVSMSTVAPETIERLAREHAEVGQVLVSATVFGRPDVAAAGKLIVVAAGPAQAVERARPLLDAMGQRVFVLGEEAPHANVVKLTGNFMTSAVIEALAEALTLVGKAGVDRDAFVQILTESLFPAPAYQIFGRALLEGRFAPGFPLPLGAKDNRLFLQAGDRHQVPLPLASLIHDRMVAALARGYGDLDWSAFSRIEAEEAGERPAPSGGP